MQEGAQGNNREKIFEGLSRLAVISTFLLGLAYMVGFVYIWWLYWLLDSVWAVKVLSSQDYISNGLPWVSTYIFVTLVVLNRFDKSDLMLEFWVRVFVFSPFAIFAFSELHYFVFKFDFSGVKIAVHLVLTVLSCSVVALVIRMIIEGGGAKKTISMTLLGLGMTLILLPAMRAVDDYRFLKGGNDLPVVTSSEGKVYGVLLGSASGKLIVYDCRSRGKLVFLETFSGLSVMPSPFPC